MTDHGPPITVNHTGSGTNRVITPLLATTVRHGDGHGQAIGGGAEYR